MRDKRVVDERTWSTHATVPPGTAGSELVGHEALPAETGPMWAPDRMSVWPVEGGRFGIDAHYHGPTGAQRARIQRQRLARQGIAAGVREDDEGAVLRLGPLTHSAAWVAIEAFIGRPVPGTESTESTEVTRSP